MGRIVTDAFRPREARGGAEIQAADPERVRTNARRSPRLVRLFDSGERSRGDAELEPVRPIRSS